MVAGELNKDTEGRAIDHGNRAEAIVASATDALIGYGVDGTILHWNPAAERLYRIPASEAVGRLVSNVLPAQAQALSGLIGGAIRGDTTADHETTWHLGDGTSVELSLSVSPITDDSGRVVGASIAARDVTERKRADAVLAGVSSILEMIAAAAPLESSLGALADLIEHSARTARCTILVVTDDGLCHGGGLDLPGVDQVPIEDLVASWPTGPEALAAMVVADLASDPRWGAIQPTALRLGLRTCWSSPIVAPGTHRLLGVFALYYTGTHLPDADDWKLLARLTHVAALAIDRDRTMEQLSHQAIHDPLTGAANRTLVADRLTHALARLERDRSPMAVLFLDLDRFKALNDRYGHDAGDKVLIEVTQRLRSAVRPSDTVGRLGGDEFVVVCERVTGELEAVGIADRIAEVVGAPFVVENDHIGLTASIGIAFPRGGETPGSLMEQADAAMYRAKEGGRARFRLFDTAMHESAVERFGIEEALRGALAGGELRLVYQPLVELEREAVIAVEALVRWAHRDWGLLEPAEFLSIAEESGSIVAIDTWVLQEACCQAAAWQSTRGPLASASVRVNVSGRQFSDPHFPGAVHRTLCQSGVRASAVVLEVPGTVVMSDPALAVPVFRALQGLGVRLSIDDFVTTPLSVSCLSSLPVDELKIDRAFVRNLDGTGDPAVVHATVALGHALGLRAVAKGVERREQVNQLRSLGCDAAQGYYWGRPATPSELGTQ